MTRILTPDSWGSELDALWAAIRGLKTAPALNNSAVQEGSTVVTDATGAERTRFGKLASYTDPSGLVSPAGYGTRLLDAAGNLIADATGFYINKQRYVFVGTNTAGTSLGPGANKVIPFTTIFDPNANWVTDTYTVPRTGKYWVASGLTSGGLATMTLFQLWIIKGVAPGTQQFVAMVQPTGTTLAISATLTGLLSLAAGDTIHVETGWSGSGGPPTLNTTAGANWLSIAYLTD